MSTQEEESQQMVDGVAVPPADEKVQADIPPQKGPSIDLGRVLFKIINDVEALRLTFNAIASSRDEAFVNLIVQRLVANDEFHKRLAEAMYAKAAEAMREGRGGASAHRPIADAPVAEEQSTVDVRPIPASEVTAGYYDFEGNQGYVEIVLNETGEGISGGKLYPNNGDEPRDLVPGVRWDDYIITAVDQSYRHVTTHEPIQHVKKGDKFWYRVDMYNPDIEQHKEKMTGEGEQS